MPQGTDALFPVDGQRDWLRLRTLILLRWMAITGQIVAIGVATRWFDLAVPLGPCFLAVGASIIANLIAVFVYPETKRLSDMQATLTLLFDLSQLAFLLMLTGGMTNPFALLILAPVTISAFSLDLRTTLVLGALAVIFSTLLLFVHVPLQLRDGPILDVPILFEVGFWLAVVTGILFMGLYSRRIATEFRAMADALLATQMALAREQKLTDLGGVVAAAAHELGTPLATIKLVSAEMIDELAGNPALQEDARLIRDQADRCRDILRSMGRAGKDDLHLRTAPLGDVLREAAEPHMARGKEVTMTLTPATDGAGPPPRQPVILRRPEVIHGLRNVIQNAVDFARSHVWLEAEWTRTRIVVRVLDDGPGYPAHLMGRIGDPFLRLRRDPAARPERPEYEGMGLGLFIAKTLLERTGADLSFANA
ncbi:MAG: sensor histidine kinase, partial [Rhodobacteraceae bacterium]|nr:sensor histidine kinase [Paracoccaceae bacterium]